MSEWRHFGIGVDDERKEVFEELISILHTDREIIKDDFVAFRLWSLWKNTKTENKGEEVIEIEPGQRYSIYGTPERIVDMSFVKPQNEEQALLVKMLKNSIETLGYRIDSDFQEFLKETDKRGYYISMNDTTDTGDGIIRFEDGDEWVDVYEITSDTPPLSEAAEEEEFYYDGKNSNLSQYPQSGGGPGHYALYGVLEDAGLPISRAD